MTRSFRGAFTRESRAKDISVPLPNYPDAKKITPCAFCGVDLFDDDAKHSEACRARRNFMDAVDDVVEAGTHVVLGPLALALRGAEWFVAVWRAKV